MKNKNIDTVNKNINIWMYRYFSNKPAEHMASTHTNTTAHLEYKQTMSELEDYKVVPLRLTPASKHSHSIYMRENKIRVLDPSKPKGRTLFLLNIPPYVTEKSLERFFSTVGEVQNVIFAEKPGREEAAKWNENCTPFSDAEPPFKFKVGYVVFKSTSSLHKALKISSIDLFVKGAEESFLESGMQLWHTKYQKRILDEKATMKLINEYIADYDERDMEAQAAAKTTDADADGWVTVGKQGHNAGFEQKESVIERLETKIERSKKKKELKNFYTFQIRESNMKNVIELRKKFEDDKRKIELLKKTRRFRPF